MAVSGGPFAYAKISSIGPFVCRSDPDYSAAGPTPDSTGFGRRRVTVSAASHHYGLSSLIFRFPPNFVRQLSTKARRNCSNIGVAQIVAASWTNPGIPSGCPSSAAAAAAASSGGNPVPAAVAVDSETVAVDSEELVGDGGDVQFEESGVNDVALFLRSDGSVTVHAGERLGRGIVTDAITTPVVNTSAYFFKKTAELNDFKVKRHVSFEYG